jgi:hypothetical protein
VYPGDLPTLASSRILDLPLKLVCSPLVGLRCEERPEAWDCSTQGQFSSARRRHALSQEWPGTYLAVVAVRRAALLHTSLLYSDLQVMDVCKLHLSGGCKASARERQRWEF